MSHIQPSFEAGVLEQGNRRSRDRMKNIDLLYQATGEHIYDYLDVQLAQ